MVTTIVYLAIMSVLGWMLIAEPFSRSTVTPATQLPLWLVELAVPIGMTLMLLRAFELLWRTWKHGADPADPDDVLAAEAEATGLTIEEIRASHEAIVSGKGEALADAVEHSREAHRHHGPRSPDSPPLQDDRYRSDTEEETDR